MSRREGKCRNQGIPSQEGLAHLLIGYWKVFN